MLGGGGGGSGGSGGSGGDGIASLSAALEYEFDDYFEMYAEARHASRTDRLFTPDEWRTESTTLTFAGVATTSYGLQLQAGVSAGLLNGGSTPVARYDASGGRRESYGWKGAAPVALVLGVSWSGELPNLDLDLDGVPDKSDKCRFSREDHDGFQDDDGCPESDNDGDGVPDGKDKCLNQSENRNGFEDEDGCPDARIEKGQQVVLQGIGFGKGSQDLTQESYLALDALVRQLHAVPEMKLEVQGHTDNLGSDQDHKRLSEARARAVVDHLVSKGIAADRLKPVGYGADKPVADNATESGRRQNRRVELLRTD
jgi:outer membrane protein OmpA-like peptidoglycan-associated protein